VQQLSDGQFWGGSSFSQGSQIFNTVSFVGTASGTWTAMIPTASLTDGASYYATARAADRAGNLQLSYTTFTYRVDLTSPTSMATYPSGTQNTVTTLSGTAQDTTPGQLDTVLLRIHDQTNSRYWNGSAWQGAQVWIASGTASSPTGQPRRGRTRRLRTCSWA